MAANCHSPSHKSEEPEVCQRKEEQAQRRALLRDEHGAPGFPAGNGNGRRGELVSGVLLPGCRDRAGPFLHHHTAPTQDSGSWGAEVETAVEVCPLTWEDMGLWPRVVPV